MIVSPAPNICTIGTVWYMRQTEQMEKKRMTAPAPNICQIDRYHTWKTVHSESAGLLADRETASKTPQSTPRRKSAKYNVGVMSRKLSIRTESALAHHDIHWARCSRPIIMCGETESSHPNVLIKWPNIMGRGKRLTSQTES